MPCKPQTETLADDSPFPFGTRYKGVPMRNVPAWYLDLAQDWRAVQMWYPNIVEYVERNRATIEKELEGR